MVQIAGVHPFVASLHSCLAEDNLCLRKPILLVAPPLKCPISSMAPPIQSSKLQKVSPVLSYVSTLNLSAPSSYPFHPHPCCQGFNFCQSFSPPRFYSVPRMSSEKLPSWKAEGDSRRRSRSRGSYTRCSPAEYISTSRRRWLPGPSLRSQWTTRWRSGSRSWVHTMRGLWQRSTAGVPAAKLTADSDTRELLAAAVPEGPCREGGVSGRSRDRKQD